MAYTDATAADLKAAFPAFAAVANDTVTFWLGRAQRSVDISWSEDDYGMGQMLMAAHLMTINGLGTGAEAQMAAAGASGFKVMRSGSLTLERFDTAAAKTTAILSTTSYGQQFKALLIVNRGGPRITPTGSVPLDPYCRYPHGQA